jgi:hypothetical protein
MGSRAFALSVVGIGAVAVAGAGVLLYRWWVRDADLRAIVAKADAALVDLTSPSDELDVDELIEDDRIVDFSSEKPKRVREKAPFRKYLYRQGKAKFGTPSCNSANRMVVRKFLVDVCKQHGVIARHIADNVDFVTEAIFVPSDDELVSMAVSKTSTAGKQRDIMRRLGGTPPRPVA